MKEEGANKRKIYPDPLEICPVNPIDYRQVNGEWILDPGWWREIKRRQDKKFEEGPVVTTRKNSGGAKK